MFYRFKPARRQLSDDSRPAPLQSRIAYAQRLWADRINRRAAALPPAKLKALLIAAGTVACCAAAALVYCGICPSSSATRRFAPRLPQLFQPITVPEHVAKRQAVDRYLDSLENTLRLDSISNAKSENHHDSSALH